MEIGNTDLWKLHLLLLDDQHLFVSGMRTVILSCYPNAIIEDFPSNNKALSRLTELLHFYKKPDLIITDFNHPGPNGIEFAQHVKLLGKNHGVIIPIIMITMVSKEYVLPDGLEASPLDGFLNKATDADHILCEIEKHIPRIVSDN